MVQNLSSLLSNAKKVSLKTDKISAYIIEPKDFSALKPLWQTLEKEVEHVALTSQWDWVETWLTNYGDVVKPSFIIGVQKEKVVGIALIAKETHRPLPLPVKAFHVGTNGEPFKEQIRMIENKFLVLPQAKTLFLTALIDTLLSAYPYEEIVFDDYAASEAAEMRKILDEKKIKYIAETERCTQFNLEVARAEKQNIISYLGKHTRHSLSRNIRAFDDDVRLEWAEDEKTALSILDEMIDLYQKKWEKMGRRGMFSSAHFSNFQRDIIKKMIKKKAVILLRIVNKTYGTLGANYFFVDNNIAYGYQLGLKDFTDIEITTINKKRIRLGFLMHVLGMQACLDKGFKAYNFSLGEYTYKEELTNDEREVTTLRIQRGIKPLLRDMIVRTYTKMDASMRSPFVLKYVRKIFKI